MSTWFEVLPALVPPTTVVVDGGATRSRAAVANRAGEVIGYSEGAPTNARSVGDEAALRNAVDVVLAATADAAFEPAQVDLCLLATAAVDTDQQARLLADGVRQRMSSRCTAVVVPDALACWAAVSDLDPATAVISGTGSVVLAADMRNGLCRSFGIGDYLLADDGSAFGIARAALTETLKWGEGRSDEREIAELCLGVLSVDAYTEIPDAVYKPHLDKAIVAGLARDLLAAADAGSPAVQSFLARQAELLAQLTVYGLRTHADRHAPVGCFGGAFTSDFYFASFSDSLRGGWEHQTPIVRHRQPTLSGVFRLLHARDPASCEAAVATFDRTLRGIIDR